jgi:hypothetical protein
MVVSIGHTLEKETGAGIYRWRLAKRMDEAFIVTNTRSRTTTAPVLPSSVPILVDGNIIHEQMFQTSVT